jgi:hypothetical protein
MPTDSPRLCDIDRSIAAAYSDLRIMRSRFDDLPSVEELLACESAENHLNGLLDQRLALGRQT